MSKTGKSTEGSAPGELVQGRLFPAAISASIDIAAPASLVWQVLTEFDRYHEWNSFCPKVSTDFELGSAVVMRVRLLPDRKPLRQVEYLNLLQPGHQFAWGYRFGGALLLQANRYQRVEALAPDQSRYSTIDQFSGLLVPLMNRLYGGYIRRGFEDMARGLKAQAEALVTDSDRRGMAD